MPILVGSLVWLVSVLALVSLIVSLLVSLAACTAVYKTQVRSVRLMGRMRAGRLYTCVYNVKPRG
jgi:hypothetical protein